jgi:hypothetical protein
MFSEYANEYRDLAEQCLAFAAAAWRVEAKTRWLELASRWQSVAEEAEKLAVKQAQQAARKSKLRH